AEAGGVAEVVDRRRLQRRYPGVTDRGQIPVDVGDDRCGGILFGTLRPVLERNESLRRVHALAEKTEAGQERDVFDTGALRQIFFHFFDRRLGAGVGRIRRGLYVGGDKALIVDRQEATGQTNERPAQADQQRRVDQHQPSGALERPAYRSSIAPLDVIEAAVEPA